MESASGISFPERSRRAVFNDLIGSFPFPLAITYARLQELLDGQKPVAAAWQMSNAFEGLIKLLASLAVPNALHARANHELASALAGHLLKPSGPGLGDWHPLIEEARRCGARKHGHLRLDGLHRHTAVNLGARLESVAEVDERQHRSYPCISRYTHGEVRDRFLYRGGNPRTVDLKGLGKQEVWDVVGRA